MYLEKRLVVDIELGNRSVDLGDSIDVALTEEKDKGYKGDMQVTYSISETVKGLTGYNKDNIENGTTINLSGVTFTEVTESVNIPVTATIAASDKYAETVINYNVVVVAKDNKEAPENGIKSLFLKIKKLVNSMWN